MRNLLEPTSLQASRPICKRMPAHLISLMDHTPGERQFRDVEKFLVYYRGKGSMTEAELQRYIEERTRAFHRKYAVPNRRGTGRARERGTRSRSPATMTRRWRMSRS